MLIVCLNEQANIQTFKHSNNFSYVIDYQIEKMTSKPIKKLIFYHILIRSR